MKKLLTLVLFSVVTLVCAQTQKIAIKVEHGHHLINALNKNGQFVIIALDMKTVQNAWEKKLKSFGKVEENKGSYTIHGGLISQVTKSPVTIYSHVSSSNTGTKIWWGIDLGNSMITPQTHPEEYKQMERILHDFAADQYVADINLQIDAAEKAVLNAGKSHEKTIQRGIQIQQDIETNKRNKADLEQKLELNKQEAAQLLKDQEQNKLDQQNAASDVLKMQKALELVKAKLNTVE